MIVGRTRSPAGDGSIESHTDFERFQAFYEFAQIRVHRFARRRMATEAGAQALTERILVSALTSFGGVPSAGDGLPADPADSALRLFAIARCVADEIARDPTLLDRPLSLHGIPVRASRAPMRRATPRARATRSPASRGRS